ncbi:MAG: hypothetical protein JO316_13520 [Abitibacteriaceae bacterium]|nr:hypothetical protein [Abditibacteriaceae bacterium]MBV9866366.1 hypothetical protein [Abditibacteriaceae bacterium]
MRGAFAQALSELAERDPRILLLTGDLGYMALEPFADKFPERFFNVGVAEQNMVGVATGLAEAGFIPYVYSIVTFASLRAYEFIRNGPIQHQLPVRIIGVGGGVEYGQNGLSHYGVEDVGVMRVQPGLTVIAPADAEQTRTAVLATYDLPGPVYFRLGKDDRMTVPGLNGRFELGRAQRIGEGRDLLLVAMGNMGRDTVAAAQILASRGITCSVLVVASLNPAPHHDLTAALSQFPVVLTVEAHYITGGVGSLVSEIVAEGGLGCRVVRCGIKTMPNGITGSQGYLHQMYGLAPEALAATALEALGKE